jgi:UPF0042 nucleotide-binding protein
VTIPQPPESQARTRPVVAVITGLSGAGRSTALHALEDLGFFCIDNLPTVLAAEAVELCERGGMTRVALGMDVRVRAFLGSVNETLKKLEHDGRSELHVVFLDASDEIILQRFSETRRPHPLAPPSEGKSGAATGVLEGVAIERERLAPLRARATRVIDTTRLSVHELRRLVTSQFGPAGEGLPMQVRVVSFGFKYGAPADADLVFDVRFLKNPYFVPELKPLTGMDARVTKFVMDLPETAEFLEHTVRLLKYVVPKYESEGKSYLTIAFGCTGGRHRSVTLANDVAATLGAVAVHRDLSRDPPPSQPRPAREPREEGR